MHFKPRFVGRRLAHPSSSVFEPFSRIFPKPKRQPQAPMHPILVPPTLCHLGVLRLICPCSLKLELSRARL